MMEVKVDDTENPSYLEFLQLENERKQLEDSITAARELLDSYKEVGMNESLVDTDGFPRSDIDVYSIRHKRVEVIRAENDYKDLMKKLENLLIKYHSQFRHVVGNQNEEEKRAPQLTGSGLPLAFVGDVKEGSPSYSAGLRNGDIILEFGSVNSNNFNSLQDISREVKKSNNMYIKVIVKRDSDIKRFNLKPKVWSGNGLLGCFLSPAQKQD